MRVAIISGALSTYHLARLTSTERVFERRSWTLCTIERLGYQPEYPWFGRRNEDPIRIFRAYVSEQPTPPDKESARRVTELLADLDPDVVVFGRNSPVFYSVLAWCVHRSIPAVQLSDSTLFDFARYIWKEWIKSRITRLYSSGFAAGTRAQEYLVTLGMSANRISIGYDVVDNDHFRQAALKARRMAGELRRELNLPEYYFLASSRLVEKKNLVRLLEAYTRYAESCEGAPWGLVMVGDGPLRDRLERVVIELELPEQVMLAGFKGYEDLPKYYGLADAFILASTSDQWGLVVNEAMASGLPVLVSERCGCAPDLVRDGVNGWTFDPFDVEQIAARMRQVASDDCDRAAMGQASREIISRWTPETFAKGLIQAVEYAMAAPLPKASMLDRALLWALGPK